ncbi:hypothetical protein PR202_gb25087 [Eleusine coracana subsp. coracana]|uniref:Uncharacterized protein n=1 Tax=Eleusine coracana subsp. coracana TaxID=191504 RepID=A0AAV5FNC7_ELECO|nr:hypothetical protein PR202_gb25087 [Eleusine coracana subsp. coracana]
MPSRGPRARSTQEVPGQTFTSARNRYVCAEPPRATDVVLGRQRRRRGCRWRREGNPAAAPASLSFSGLPNPTTLLKPELIGPRLRPTRTSWWPWSDKMVPLNLDLTAAVAPGVVGKSNTDHPWSENESPTTPRRRGNDHAFTAATGRSLRLYVLFPRVLGAVPAPPSHPWTTAWRPKTASRRPSTTLYFRWVAAHHRVHHDLRRR